MAICERSLGRHASIVRATWLVSATLGLTGCAMIEESRQRDLWSTVKAGLPAMDQARLEACAGEPMERRPDGAITTTRYGVTQQFEFGSSWCVMDVRFQGGRVRDYSIRSGNPGGLTDGSMTCGLIFGGCFGDGNAMQRAASTPGTVHVTRMQGDATEAIASAQRAGQQASNLGLLSFMLGAVPGMSAIGAGTANRNATPLGAPVSSLGGPGLAPMFPVPQSRAAGIGAAAAGMPGQQVDTEGAVPQHAVRPRVEFASPTVELDDAIRKARASRESRPSQIDGCPTSIEHLASELPICPDNQSLNKLRELILLTDASFVEGQAAGYTLRQIAMTAAQATRQQDESLRAAEQAMLETSANAELAGRRIAALRQTPPRCDAAPEGSFGMSENAYGAFVRAFMFAKANRAVSVIAACRARARP